MLWSEWVSFSLEEGVFWSSTVDEVDAVLQRARERVGRLDMLAGMIAAQVVNFAGRVAPRPVDWKHFFRAVPAGGAGIDPEAQARFEGRPLMRHARTTRRLIS